MNQIYLRDQFFSAHKNFSEKLAIFISTYVEVSEDTKC